MVVAIFCGHPYNLEDSDESERGTVARFSLPIRFKTCALSTVRLFGYGNHLSYRRTTPLAPTIQPIFFLK